MPLRLVLALTLLPALLLSLATLPAAAGTGAAELQLDRGAVGALLQAHLPARTAVALPPLGRITLAVTAPDPVSFVDGALETSLRVEIIEARMGGRVTVRMVPEVDKDGGTLVFRTTRAQPTGELAGLPDLAPLLPPIELPRVFDWLAGPDSGSAGTRFTVAVQGVTVGAERMTVKMGLATRPAASAARPPAAPSRPAAPPARPPTSK
ncbi:MAG: hypothetical protein MUF27_14550 [Acidobacteria bacterium]|jgi:hypothetical protein|nr:hypothetical protein [Acidobacteriota bacterium]